MIQEIITYLIILSATIYTVYNFYKFIIPSKNSSHLCSGGCSGCALSKNANNSKIKIIKFN